MQSSSLAGFAGSENFGDRLEADLLARLGRLGIALSFDI